MKRQTRRQRPSELNGREFEQWLKQMPSADEQTITVDLTLDTDSWLYVASGCAKSGLSISQAVSCLLRYSDEIAGWANADYTVKDGVPQIV